MLLTTVVIISGFSLGDVANELITWVDQYNDKNNDKATDSGDEPYAAAHQQDILLHMTTATFGYLLFFWMTLSGFIWSWSFLKIENAGDDLVCE